MRLNLSDEVGYRGDQRENRVSENTFWKGHDLKEDNHRTLVACIIRICINKSAFLSSNGILQCQFLI
jgi:hypothetical protein